MESKVIFRLYQIDKALPWEVIQDHISLETTDDIMPEIYRLVWESKEKSDLDDLYNKYNNDNRPNNYVCRSLSVSDIVEIEDRNISTFYLCNNFGWLEIEFDKSKVPSEMGFKEWYVNIDIERRRALRIEVTSKAVVQIMAQRLQKSNKAVMNIFRKSKIYESLYDEKKDLWAESPYYVVDAFEKEIKGNNLGI